MEDLREQLDAAGCILEGEFFFSLKKPGLVSKKYINIDPVLTRPVLLNRICRELVMPFQGKFDSIVGPATGGIPLAYLCAEEARRAEWFECYTPDARVAFAAKDGQGFTFDRMGFADAVKGRRTLVVEDISTSGDTTDKVCRLIEHCGGTVIGVSFIWIRGYVDARVLGVPRTNALITEGVETYNVNDAPPPGWGTQPLVMDVGHPEHFPDYPGPTIKLLAA